MTDVKFWADGDIDGLAEYQRIKACHPTLGKAIRDAITLIVENPDSAAKQYSIRLDPQAGYLGLPFETPNGLTCLTWRQDPDGYDCVEVIDFSQPWGDLPRPPVWPRHE
ncbi:MAG TPA: hypothetical protein VKS82_16205 [Streptosporangiaceae bacterium]|nr:hypothetical protein [Streptosporangiaceae bacterium]